MKTNPLIRITTGLAAILITPAYAIEAPADDAPPPPIVEAQPAGPAPAAEAPKPAEQPEAAAVDAAYLGVMSSAIPQMLSDHLGLKEGEGIIVRAVMPDGPAAKAGLAENDIITRVGDKAVGSAQDLSDLVKARKPGEQVHLDVIQKGKAGGIDVALGKRPARIGEMNVKPLDELDLGGLPKDIEQRLRGMIEGNIGGMKLDIQEGQLQIAPQIDEAMRDMKKRMEDNKGALEGLKNAIQGQINIQQGATFRLLDQKGSVELKSNDGGKEVTIRDKDDKITWSGPWDTEQDKAAAPDDVRERVERLNIDTRFNGNGFRLQMGAPAQPENPE